MAGPFRLIVRRWPAVNDYGPELGQMHVVLAHGTDSKQTVRDSALSPPWPLIASG